jgi:hypothetical protein
MWAQRRADQHSVLGNGGLAASNNHVAEGIIGNRLTEPTRVCDHPHVCPRGVLRASQCVYRLESLEGDARS